MLPLVVTSICFVIPGVINFRRGRKVRGVVDCGMALVSANHWRDPRPGWRYNLDRVCAVGTAVVHGVQPNPNANVGILVISAWLKSWNAHLRGGDFRPWHVCFHAITCVGMLTGE